MLQRGMCPDGKINTVASNLANALSSSLPRLTAIKPSLTALYADDLERSGVSVDAVDIVAVDRDLVSARTSKTKMATFMAAVNTEEELVEMLKQHRK